jgi:hypothetical protein
VPVLCYPLDHVFSRVVTYCWRQNIPRFGLGSRSCAGREKRTAARSDTPINLQHHRVSRLCLGVYVPCLVSLCMRRHSATPGTTTYFLRIPSRVLNLDPSSTGFSAGALDGVPALDVSLELRAEAVVEPGRGFSADRSAMSAGLCFSRRGSRGEREREREWGME